MSTENDGVEAMGPLKRFLALDEAMLIRVRRWELPPLALVMRSFTRACDASTWVLLALTLVLIGGDAWDELEPCMAGFSVENSTRFVFADAIYRYYRPTWEACTWRGGSRRARASG